MKPERTYLTALWLCGVSVIAVIVAVLALQDIYHNEADLSLEWAALRVCFAIIIVFHVVGFRALRRALSQG